MSTLPANEGLTVINDLDVDQDDDARATEEARDDLDGEAVSWQSAADSDLESLRDAFVEGFNARDLEALLGLASADVECPDISGDGAAVLAEELEAIWERSPAAILTRAFVDEQPCAVAWLPDDDGCWQRAALVCFDHVDDLITLVALPEDADCLDRAITEEPTGEELDEWADWAEWERGEESPGNNGRSR